MLTVKEGSLLNQTYKGSTIESENVTLVGSEMILQGKKVTKFIGDIQNSGKEAIGSFDYRNSNDNMSPERGYKCHVSIYKLEQAQLQIEATSTLLLGIGEFEKL